MIRIIAVGLLLLTASDFATAGEAAAPGLRAAKPEAGRFVETRQGFMVPYTVMIPGSQGSFEMMPNGRPSP